MHVHRAHITLRRTSRKDPTGVSTDDGRSAIGGETYWKREAFAIHLNFIDELPIRSGQPK